MEMEKIRYKSITIIAVAALVCIMMITIVMRITNTDQHNMDACQTISNEVIRATCITGLK